MIQAHCSKEYYDGCRDALYQYAIHRSGGLEVGSTGKTYKAAVAEVNTMQEESARCVIWRLMRDSKTDSPDYTDEMGCPLWMGASIDLIRHQAWLVLAALLRTANNDDRLALYNRLKESQAGFEDLILGNRPDTDTPNGSGVVIDSRATVRRLLAETFNTFAEVFGYTEEFR